MGSLDEPNMSDTTLLVSVEDLINIGLGAPQVNIVNFKVVQTVLHILARQQRLLQQKVEIRVTDGRHETSPEPLRQKSERRRKAKEPASESSSSKSPRSPSPVKRMKGIREEREVKSKDKADKDKTKAEKEAQKEKEKALKAQDKADKIASKEKEKADKALQKETEKVQKEKEKAERAASKEREKAERAASKERDKAERPTSRERDKAEKAESKERDKAERTASKERDKAERAESKERDRAERAASKEREKEERAAAKEKEKEVKATAKDREREEKAAAKEREREEKTLAKEREREEKAASKEKAVKGAAKAERKDKEVTEKEEARALKEKEKREKTPPSIVDTKLKKKARTESTSSIKITEVERDKQKVLIVEKGPTTRADSRVGSIDVVTQSQFALLEAAVKSLMERTAPMAELRMPDNKKLRGELAKGSASLTDTMQAMQVNARVKAAEEGIERMAGLLTQLAAAGALPEEMAGQLEEVKRDVEQKLQSDNEEMPIKPTSMAPRKSVAIDPVAKMSEISRPSTVRPSSVPTPRGSISTVMGRASVISQPSSTVTTAPEPGVTRGEMEDVIKAVRDDLSKTMNFATTKAMAAAESALHTAKAVAEKLDVALKLNTRISSLYSLVTDYAEQLSGFDAGLTTQMQSFQEQIGQIRNDLKGGLTLLESVNNNAETAAVMELTERYEDLVSELDRTVHAHQALTAFQSQLGDELHSLVECVEMLREEKADRDEVIDGLRDKADTSRLAGLLTEEEFAKARNELTHRLEVCHDKFHRQDVIWMGAIKDLLMCTDQKAEFIDLLSMKDDTQRQLRELHDKLRLLATALGEPEAALLTRQLAAGAACGACGASALMPMKDRSFGKPPALPALRPPTQAPPDEPCLQDWIQPDEEEDTRHMCHRWCGGSHTLLSEHTTREQAPPMDLKGVPTRRFADYGLDGRLYMMEEELQPCLECNVILEKSMKRPPPVGDDGAGDGAAIKMADLEGLPADE